MGQVAGSCCKEITSAAAEEVLKISRGDGRWERASESSRLPTDLSLHRGRMYLRSASQTNITNSDIDSSSLWPNESKEQRASRERNHTSASRVRGAHVDMSPHVDVRKSSDQYSDERGGSTALNYVARELHTDLAYIEADLKKLKEKLPKDLKELPDQVSLAIDRKLTPFFSEVASIRGLESLKSCEHISARLRNEIEDLRQPQRGEEILKQLQRLDGRLTSFERQMSHLRNEIQMHGKKPSVATTNDKKTRTVTDPGMGYFPQGAASSSNVHTSDKKNISPVASSSIGHEKNQEDALKLLTDTKATTRSMLRDVYRTAIPLATNDKVTHTHKSK